MIPIFIHYPKCTTCQRAAAWLRANGIDFTERNIVTDNPKAAEISAWVARSDREVTKFFNTSGLRYKALGLKDRVKTTPPDQLIELLATEGMLVKRPVLVTDSTVLVGFKEAEWSAALLGK
ncbi:MAG: arsenate reductase family protein [Mucinivorans sp.]